MTLKLPTSIISSLILVITLAASAAAQQKRRTPARTPPPAPTPAPTPPPTLDTLLAADSYRIYGEVRSVGQLIRSNSVNEILEPILKLAGPPREFRTVVKWLNTHADEVMSSRLLVAGWSSGKDLPQVLVAIEFASPEEAAKFQQQLSGFLEMVMPAPTLAPSDEANKAQAPPPAAPYHMQRAGSLILITPTPLNLKKLRPAGSKLLSEDVNFRVARNRLNTESIFVFVDAAGIEKEEQERRKKFEEEYRKTTAERAATAEAAEAPKVEPVTNPEETEPPPPEKQTIVGVETELEATASAQQPIQAVAAPPIGFALSMIMSSLTSVQPTWPVAVGAGISLEGESFDVRALLVNAPGENSDPMPFLPMLAPGPAIAPEAPGILPADTEMLITMSLDLPKMYALLSGPQLDPVAVGFRAEPGVLKAEEPLLPLAALEQQLKIKFKDDLLPLIGSEIVVSVPMTGMGWFQPPQPPQSAPPESATPGALPSPQPSPDASSTPNESGDNFTVTEVTVGPSKDRSLAIAISLRDKQGMRALLPKLVESLAFKGANSFAQTERREDTELVSYANVVSYAFIGNFLVLSPDVATTRHIVDSYLKRETLSGEPHFKNYTRWQPRQLQGQIYISPSLMETYRTWIQQPNAPIDEQTRAFLTRFSIVPQPVTYSLSNEGFGPLHELHVPKNLVLFLIAAVSGTPSPAPVSNPQPTPPDNPPPPIPANPY